jgi:hypothetical protein
MSLPEVVFPWRCTMPWGDRQLAHIHQRRQKWISRRGLFRRADDGGPENQEAEIILPSVFRDFARSGLDNISYAITDGLIEQNDAGPE